MKSKQLFAAFGNINDRFIDEDAEAPADADKAMPPVPFYRNRAIIHYVTATACAAVLLLCVWIIVKTPGDNPPNNLGIIASGDLQAGEPGEQAGIIPPDDLQAGEASGGQDSGQGGEQATIATEPPDNLPPAPDEIWPLTLNEADSQISADYSPGVFWWELNAAQLDSVFPNLPFPITATAFYHENGALSEVWAYEIDDYGEVTTYTALQPLLPSQTERTMASFIRTEIRLSTSGNIVDCVAYTNHEPIATSIWGVSVLAGVFGNKDDDGMALYTAEFTLDGIAYSIKIYDSDVGESGKDHLTHIVNAIIRNDMTDLSTLSNPAIPELINRKLSLEEALSDPDFGAYIPESVPANFRLDFAQRYLNQEINSLSVFWGMGYDYIHWSVSESSEYDRECIVARSEREKYDLALYPIPRAESVPDELWKYVNSPVFFAEELTLDVIQARAYQIDDQGDSPGWRMDFGVLFDNVIVRVSIKGASPEQVLEMFVGLGIELD